MTAAEWIASRRSATTFAHVALGSALDALEAVLAPHQMREVPGGQRWCLHCGGDWPCPTVDAAETALRGDS